MHAYGRVVEDPVLYMEKQIVIPYVKKKKNIITVYMTVFATEVYAEKKCIQQREPFTCQ